MIFDFYRTPKIFGVFLFIYFSCFFLAAQELPRKEIVKTEQEPLYDTDLLSKEFHSGRRDALRKLMEDSSVAVFFSATVKKCSNDVNYEFHQDPNFYYFTGLKEPKAVLMVFKNEILIEGTAINEILFLQDKNSKAEQWTGRLLGTDGAKNVLGFQVSLSSSSFSEFKIKTHSLRKVYSFKEQQEEMDDLYWKFFSKLSPDNYSLKEIMAELREIKSAEELNLMRQAINITCEGIKEAMKALEPGMKEYDVEAIVEYIFKSQGAEEVGYPSIVGAGENSCIVHYETNRKKLQVKDMLVCDVGAAYHGYNADVTRTIPVNGKFSADQKKLYNIVLEAQLAAISKCKPGEYFRAPHNAATEVIQQGLLELGIIKLSNEVSKYFFHGTSHYLGLDVHDAGMHGKLLPNSVITVEPGIYIPAGSDCDEKWWNMGVRIEDDILITYTEPEVLSACVPKTIDEIEAIMKKESLFNLLKK